MHAVHGKGVRGQAPPRKFKKWCDLVRFGGYFDQMFLKIIPKITIFIYKLIILPVHNLFSWEA